MVGCLVTYKRKETADLLRAIFLVHRVRFTYELEALGSCAQEGTVGSFSDEMNDDRWFMVVLSVSWFLARLDDVITGTILATSLTRGNESLTCAP